MEKLILDKMKYKGFITEEEILPNLILGFGNVYSSEIKYKFIPQLIDKYNLKRIKLTEELKETMGMTFIKGYPFILLFNLI